jgi:hypothetical protein
MGRARGLGVGRAAATCCCRCRRCLLQVVFASRTGEISGVFESQGLILGVLETTMRCSVRWYMCLFAVRSS